MGEIAVSMLPTAAGQQSAPGTLVIHDGGVAFRYGEEWPLNFPWAKVSKIAFEDPGQTKVNTAAVLLFGPIGLLSRRNFTLIVLSTTDRDYFFEQNDGVVTWRTTAARIVAEVPNAAGKVVVQGRVMGSTGPVAEHNSDPLDQIKKLGELHEAGLLTAEEFEAKKAELLERL
jgi:hypothetical protein